MALTLGKTTDGASSSVLGGADNLWASSFTPTISGRVQTLTTRVWLSGAGTGTFRGVIFSDNAGEPNTLLAVTDDKTFTNTTEAEVTAVFSGANLINLTNGTAYWIGIHWQDPGGGVTISGSRDATANLRRVGNGDTFTGGTQTPFSAPTTTLAGPIDVYVNYTPTSSGMFQFMN